MLKVVATSKSKENAAAYVSYAALPDELRLSLLRAINVLDASPNIIDVRDEIARELYHAAARDQVDHLVERLEGWWFGIVVRALTGAELNAIPVLAVEQRVDELREEFKRDALPVDCKTVAPSAVIAELDKRPFVHQLRRIEIGPIRSSGPSATITAPPNNGRVGHARIF